DGETATVQLDISSTRYNSSLSYPNKRYLKISLENLMTKQLVISAGTAGTVAEGYALGEVTVTNPNVLKISGPESIVSTVDSVVATIDVDGMSVNISDNVVPRLYDAAGRTIDTTRLTLSSTTVTVSARILSVKTIPLNFSTVGTPMMGYSVASITGTLSEVQVKGTAATLNPILSIDIPDELFDVTGLTEDMVSEIDITEYLPEGVELVDAADAKVTVTVKIIASSGTADEGSVADDESEEPAEAE
ncbi:MAG: hypothetical protein LUI02_03410, partial [Clostridiales bacterium]|nr:hypothetical protein [Clostridiales bacterium]